MRGLLVTLFVLALAPSAPASGDTVDQSRMCDAPPCTRRELEAYERRVIKRMQRANRLSFEARYRGETELADHLRQVYDRNRDRRAAALKAMESTSN